MFVHKILRGIGAEKYLPFALSRLKLLERTWGSAGVYQQKYEIDDAKIEVSQDPPYQYVRITAGGPFFEFFTNGNPVRRGLIQDVEGNILPFFQYASIAVGLSLKKEDDTKKIVLTPRTRGRSGVTSIERSPSNRFPQIQLADEPAYFTEGRIIYESMAPFSSFTGDGMLRLLNDNPNSWAYTYPDKPCFAHGTGALHFAIRDTGYDVRFDYVSKNSHWTRHAVITENADYPRANAICKVIDPIHGTRVFGIMNDAFNQFFVFPLNAIDTTIPVFPQNIDPALIKKVNFTMPSWVHANADKIKDFVGYFHGDPDGGYKTTLLASEIDWKFSADGKKACAVVLERIGTDFDWEYFYFDYGPDHFTEEYWLYFNTGCGALHRSHGTDPLVFSGQYWTAPYDPPYSWAVAPGLLELLIDIKITGTDLDQFSVTGTLNEIRRPTTTPYCTMLAGYPWEDIKDVVTDVVIAKAGDLIVFDVERWYNQTTVEAKSFISCKNLTKGTELKALHGSAILDYDFPTLSFVLREHVDEDTTIFIPQNQHPEILISQPVKTRQWCTSIWIKGVLTDVFYPEKMSPEKKILVTNAIYTNPRSALSPPEQWVLMPLNDLRDWYDPELDKMRYELSTDPDTPFELHWLNPVILIHHMHKLHDDDHPGPGDPSQATRDWLATAVRSFADARHLIFARFPCFGWFTYADEIMSRLWLSPHSVFFVHPNGTWAYYSNALFYNNNPVSSLLTSAQTIGLFDVTKFEHTCFDRIHFVMEEKKEGEIVKYTKDSTFLEMYNKAITEDTEKQEELDLKPLLRTDLIMKDVLLTYPTFPNTSIQFTEISCNAWGTRLFTYDTSFQQHIPPYTFTSGSGATHTHPVGDRIYASSMGQFLDMTAGSSWSLYSIADPSQISEYNGIRTTGLILMSPVSLLMPTFSSCTLLL